MRRSRPRITRLEDRTTPSTLISVGSPRDLVFDHVRNRLYVTTGTGSVARYDLATSSLLPVVAAGTNHNGADITPDGQYLYVAENARGPTQGFFYKIDLNPATPTATLVPYNLGFGEGGAWDIAIGPTGAALTTTRYEGSGWVDSRILSIATGTFTPAGRTVRQDTHLHRSADRSLVFLTESNISSGDMSTYRFASGFSPVARASQFFGSVRSAVNRDGTVMASEVGTAAVTVAPNFDALHALAGFDGGMVFDPTRDVLYAVNSTTNQIAAFDTTTGREKFRFAAEENVAASGALGAGTMAVSSDGTRLFLITPGGVRMYDIPESSGVASRFQISDFSLYHATGVPTTVTVTALDPAGNIATSYTGTVALTSSDPAAVLPAAHTFTPADAGRHTFTFTWTTPGSRTVTAEHTGGALITATSPAAMVIGPGPVTLLPLTTRRDFVYDDAHGLLLISTSTGSVDRYDPATRSFLPGLPVGVSLNGLDVLIDGSVACVAEGQRSLTQSVVRRFDPLTGSSTVVRHTADGGAWDLVLDGNGIGLVDYRFEGSGNVTLDRLNVAAGTLTPTGRMVRQNSNLYRGAGRNLFFATESNISSGPVFTYNPATGTFPSTANTGAFLDNNFAAVNRTGTLIAMEFGTGVTVMNATLGTVQLLGGLDGGVAFDPIRDVLYGVNSVTDQLIAYDTATWAVKYSLPIGENVPASEAFNNGVMTVNGDGRLLFLSTPGGIRVFDIAPTLTATTVPTVTTGGTATVTVTARTPSGAVDTTYRGAVTLFSSDGAATLPAAYMFTAADNGVHDFTVTFRTVGPQTVTATDDLVSRPVDAQITVLPARLSTLQVNGGEVQRSRVTSLTVSFDAAVSFVGAVADAFTLVRTGGGAVTFNADVNIVNGRTVVTLSAFSGGEVEFGSLRDGRYTLTAVATQIVAGGALLNNGVDESFGDANGLYRMYGDMTGERRVDIADFGFFSLAFLNTANYNAALDFNNDGRIDIADFGQFSLRYFTNLP